MDAVIQVARASIAAVLVLSSAACDRYLDHKWLTLFRWSVTGPDGAVRSSGCGFSSQRHSGRIAFRAEPDEDLVETVRWEEVSKTSEKLLSSEEEFWCTDQADVETTRKPHVLYGEECIVASHWDSVAKLDAVELVDPLASDTASGVRLRLKVVRAGPLQLTYKFPCDSSDRVHTDAWVPPIWTELTIQP
jgi:hypothetical protein